MKKLISTGLVLAPFFAFAAEATEGGHHDASHIPWESIGWQAANLGILLIALFFFLRKSILETFADRQKNFIDQAEKTKKALKEAEIALSDIKNKLKDLEAGEQSALETAKHDSNVQKANIIKDAETMAIKMKTDAKLILNNEINKAKQEVNDMILKSAVNETSKKINENALQIAKSSEARFISEIAQVRQ